MRIETIDHFAVWTPWFAWRPVHVDKTLVWWEPLERRLRMHGYDSVWDYRFPQEAA